MIIVIVIVVLVYNDSDYYTTTITIDALLSLMYSLMLVDMAYFKFPIPV